MKKKSTSYTLLLVVVLLWGVLIYKFVGDWSGDIVESKEYQATTYTVPKSKEKEVYILVPIGKDPFLGTLSKAKNTSTKKKMSKPVSTINWPQVGYKGIVKGEKNTAFIISINGQDYILNKGEEYNDIKLINGNKKEITLRYQGETKKIAL